MKKTVILVITVMLLTLVFAGVAAANAVSDGDYVGKDMELAEGEMGIVSIDEDYVGKDMELAEGEMGIVSIDEDYVGKDMELAEGEMGIVSIDEDYVGKDMELAEGEAGIISIDLDEEDEKTNFPLYGGIGFLTLGLFFFTYKKVFN
jgi:DNA-binding cell septation regulator SpoVG